MEKARDCARPPSPCVRRALSKGFKAVELETDSENLTGALRLYTKVGMRVIRQTYVYEKELRPGVDLATRELR